MKRKSKRQYLSQGKCLSQANEKFFFLNSKIRPITLGCYFFERRTCRALKLPLVCLFHFFFMRKDRSTSLFMNIRVMFLPISTPTCQYLLETFENQIKSAKTACKLLSTRQNRRNQNERNFFFVHKKSNKELAIDLRLDLCVVSLFFFESRSLSRCITLSVDFAPQSVHKCGTQVCGFAFEFERLQIATIWYSSAFRSLIYFPPCKIGVESARHTKCLLHTVATMWTTTTTHIDVYIHIWSSPSQRLKMPGLGKINGTHGIYVYAFIWYLLLCEEHHQQ